jgi:hypothetical protein
MEEIEVNDAMKRYGGWRQRVALSLPPSSAFCLVFGVEYRGLGRTGPDRTKGGSMFTSTCRMSIMVEKA